MTYTVDGVALTGFTAATLTLGAGRPGALNNLNVSPNSTIDGAEPTRWSPAATTTPSRT